MNFVQHILRWDFFLKVLTVIVVDLTLSGDNAVVIAAAAKPLPAAMKKRALIGGALCAVVALAVATFFATFLLHVKFLQLAGGLMILWIALGLFKEEPPLESSALHCASFWKAMWFIIVADVTMSTDNILAVAGIAQGDMALLILGLGVSISLVVFASGILASLMDRFPVIVQLGAALLGKVAGQMIMTDGFVVQTFAPSTTLVYAAEAIGAVGVVAIGMWIKKRRSSDSGESAHS
jgi:YjbE family integral membrane protein